MIIIGFNVIESQGTVAIQYIRVSKLAGRVECFWLSKQQKWREEKIFYAQQDLPGWPT